MTHETGKSIIRRSSDIRFATRYFVGDAIDIGSGDDSLARYQHMFPLLKSIRSFDRDDGDAMMMASVPSCSYDLVHSSHCLEHMADPFLAMEHWIRICKPGGYLVITVPDFEQYEHGLWPSRFNAEHEWCFSLDGQSQHAHHIVLTSPANGLHTLIFSNRARLLKLELVERGYDPRAEMVPYDQSLSLVCEPAIEVICQRMVWR